MTFTAGPAEAAPGGSNPGYELKILYYKVAILSSFTGCAFAAHRPASNFIRLMIFVPVFNARSEINYEKLQSSKP
jgi:hypothetical protein